MLKNTTELEAYLRKGLSEIHWDSEKIGHFTLISQLLSSQYREQMVKNIRNIVQHYSEEKFREALQVVDKDLPEAFNQVKIPQNRKDLIVKLVSLRAQKLQELIR